MRYVARLFNDFSKEVEREMDSLAAERRGLLSASTSRRWPAVRRHTSTASKRHASQISVSSNPSEYQAIWQQHEELWSSFESLRNQTISYDTIPFPPCDADVFDFLIQANRGLDAKSVYQLACRRWHPDKFIQSFGARIPPGDLPAVSQRLTSISQEINVRWAAEKARLARIAKAQN